MQKNTSSIQFHEDIAIADTAFTVKGKNEEELFVNAAKALVMSMADISRINAKKKRKFNLKSNKLDTLLFDFLSELLLYKDSENLLFSSFKIVISRNKSWKLEAECLGELANPKKHKISTDIKAITMHMFEVNKTDEGYEARIVVDI
jgi:SHS2 domain-containing protein